MSLSSTKRNMIENEAVFRKHNEKLNHRVKQEFKKVKEIAQEDNQEHLIDDENLPLHFYCECTDENCQDRVIAGQKQYDEIHKNRRHFVVVPGHEVSETEKVISAKKDYNIVEKFVTPSENVQTLKPTDIDNS